MAGYWVKLQDQVSGPFDKAGLQQLIKEGQLTADHLVGSSAEGPWAPLNRAAQPAAEGGNWFYIVSGFASDSQKGPFSTAEMVQLRDRKEITDGTAVYHPGLYADQWTPFQETSLVDHYQAMQHEREARRQEEMRRQAELQEQQRQEAERQRQEEMRRQEELQAQQQETQRIAMAQMQQQQAEQQQQLQLVMQGIDQLKSKCSPAAQDWIARATAEQYWVRKDYYHLRGYLETFVPNRLGSPAVSGHLQQADNHDNFKAAIWLTLSAFFEVARECYPPNPQAEQVILQVGQTDVWDGCSCYTLEALLYQIPGLTAEHEQLAMQEFENRHRHSAWLCSIYYAIRAIIIKRNGPLEINPRVNNVFQTAENGFDVWQALVSHGYIALLEVDLFGAVTLPGSLVAPVADIPPPPEHLTRKAGSPDLNFPS